MKAEEHKIICLLKQGDSATFKYLYDHYYTFLCYVAYQYIHDSFLASTVVEDFIYHLWEKRGSLEIKGSIRNYCVRSIRNRCLNYLDLTQQKKEINFSSVDWKDNHILQNMEEMDYPLTLLLTHELEDIINQSVENLPEECKRVFKMSRYEEKSYEDISTALGISVNTVKYHMKNALFRLHSALSTYLIP